MLREADANGDGLINYDGEDEKPFPSPYPTNYRPLLPSTEFVKVRLLVTGQVYASVVCADAHVSQMMMDK